MDAKGYSRRTRSEEGSIEGRPGSDHPSKDPDADELFMTDYTSNAYERAEQDEAKQRQKHDFRVISEANLRPMGYYTPKPSYNRLTTTF